MMNNLGISSIILRYLRAKWAGTRFIHTTSCLHHNQTSCYKSDVNRIVEAGILGMTWQQYDRGVHGLGLQVYSKDGRLYRTRTQVTPRNGKIHSLGGLRDILIYNKECGVRRCLLRSDEPNWWTNVSRRSCEYQQLVYRCIFNNKSRYEKECSSLLKIAWTR